MSKVLVYTFRTFKYGGLLLLLSLVCFTSCFNFRTSNKKTLDKLQKNGVNGRFKSKKFAGLSINYLTTGTNLSNCVVFVHGSPGANDAFIDYMQDSTLLNNATLVSIDRPGYGYSDRKKSYYTIQEQSDAIGELLKRLKENYGKLIVVGHSYGATMVAKLAMDCDSLIDASIQISGAVDPANEKIFWFSRLANSPLVYWSLSKTLKVTTKEKMNHVKDIKSSLMQWAKIMHPYTIIHGDEDGLVPYANFNYTKNKLESKNPKLISVKDGGHLLIWDHYNLVRDEILLLLK
ncbi:MAG: alpha/beta hydrolase [Bacteroidia bacterium]